MTTATKTQTFKRAISVSRSDTGCYEFTGHEMFFDDATSYRGREFTWEIVEPLKGWGGWSHCVRVNYGPASSYFFAR